MVRTLCVRMVRLLGRGAGNAHEDVVQGGLHEGETGHARLRHQSAQNLLRIGAARQPQFLHLSQVADLFDSGKLLHRRDAAGGCNPYGVLAVPVLNGAEGAVQHLPAAEDHEDVVAHGFRKLHVVGAEDDRDAAPAEIQNGGADGVRAHRVETAEGFVQDEEFRFGDYGGDELNLLAHALAERFHLVGGAAGQVQPREPLRDFGFDAAAGTQLPVEFQQCLDRHFLVKAALFGKVSDKVRAGFRPALSEKADVPAVGIKDVHDHAHRGGFARAVRPDKPVDRTLGYREGEVVYRGHTPEGPGYVRDLYGVHSLEW